MTVMTVHRSHQLHLKGQGRNRTHVGGHNQQGHCKDVPLHLYLDVCTVQWFGVSERDNDREGN